MSTPNEVICDMMVDSMSHEQLKGYVFEDLAALHQHDEALLKLNFFTLSHQQQLEILEKFPKFKVCSAHLESCDNDGYCNECGYQ